MKIDAKSDYHGAPLVQVRDLLRKNRDGFEEKWFCGCFGDKTGLGKGILKGLAKDGFIRRNPISDAEFELTAKGQQLAGATAMPKVRREVSTKALGKMLERVREINEDPEYLYRVTDIKVFGNYLGGAEKLSDVDLCVNLMPKFAEHDFEKKSKARIREEMDKGRRFRNIREQMVWPRRQVLDYLRGKGGRLSIIEDGEGILVESGWEFLFRIESGTNLARFPELNNT